MMRRIAPRLCSLSAIPLVWLSTLVLLASSDAADKYKEYSARQVIIHQGNEQTASTLYVAPGKMRIEHHSPGADHSMVIIIRQDKKLTWTLFPEKKTFLESALTEEDMKKYVDIPQAPKGADVKEEILGKETINGYPCTKRRIETTVEVMGKKMRSSSTIWMSDMFEVPLRTQHDSGTIVELRNITPAPQRASLFEIPEGFTKISHISEAFGPPGTEEGGQLDDEGEERASPGVSLPADIPEEVRKIMEQHRKSRPGGR